VAGFIRYCSYLNRFYEVSSLRETKRKKSLIQTEPFGDSPLKNPLQSESQSRRADFFLERPRDKKYYRGTFRANNYNSSPLIYNCNRFVDINKNHLHSLSKFPEMNGYKLCRERRCNSMPMSPQLTVEPDAEDDDVNFRRSSYQRSIKYPGLVCLPPPAKFEAIQTTPARFSRRQRSNSCTDRFQSSEPSFNQVD
jgi:hypothetical protein